MKRRIYIVKDTEGGDSFLVQATNQPAARNAVLRDRFSVELADQLQLVALLKAGVVIMDASADEDDDGDAAKRK